VFVSGGKKSNYNNNAWGVVTDKPNHAEARAIEYMNRNNIPTQNARQATTLPSCIFCLGLQDDFGIINITG